MVLHLLIFVFQIMVLVIKCQIMVKQCGDYDALDHVLSYHGLGYICLHYNQIVFNQ